MTAKPVCAGNLRNKSDISLLNFWSTAPPPNFWKKKNLGLRRTKILRTSGRKRNLKCCFLSSVLSSCLLVACLSSCSNKTWHQQLFVCLCRRGSRGWTEHDNFLHSPTPGTYFVTIAIFYDISSDNNPILPTYCIINLIIAVWNSRPLHWCGFDTLQKVTHVTMVTWDYLNLFCLTQLGAFCSSIYCKQNLPYPFLIPGVVFNFCPHFALPKSPLC